MPSCRRLVGQRRHDDLCSGKASIACIGIPWSGLDVSDNDRATFHCGGTKGFLGQSTETLICRMTAICQERRNRCPTYGSIGYLEPRVWDFEIATDVIVK
jgi:hypothetical protein